MEQSRLNDLYLLRSAWEVLKTLENAILERYDLAGCRGVAVCAG